MVLLTELAKTPMNSLRPIAKEVMAGFLDSISKKFPGEKSAHYKLYRCLISRVNEKVLLFNRVYEVNGEKIRYMIQMSPDGISYLVGGEADYERKRVSLYISKDMAQDFLQSQDKVTAYKKIWKEIEDTIVHETTHIFQYQNKDDEDDSLWYTNEVREFHKNLEYLFYVTQPIETQAVFNEAKHLYDRLKKKSVTFYHCLLAKYSLMFCRTDDYFNDCLMGNMTLQKVIKQIKSSAKKSYRLALYYIFGVALLSSAYKHLVTRDEDYIREVASNIKSLELLESNYNNLITLAEDVTHARKKTKFKQLARDGVKEGWFDRLFSINLTNKRLIQRILAVLNLSVQNRTR